MDRIVEIHHTDADNKKVMVADDKGRLRHVADVKIDKGHVTVSHPERNSESPDTFIDFGDHFGHKGFFNGEKG